MTERKLSTLGYLMDRLGLSTAALARRLHWTPALGANGAAAAGGSALSPYILMRVCRMLLEQNPMALTDALRSLVPLEEPKRKRRVERGGRQPVRRWRGYGDRGYIRNLADRREQKSCFTAC